MSKITPKTADSESKKNDKSKIDKNAKTLQNLVLKL